jgi:hypothetical protein
MDIQQIVKMLSQIEVKRKADQVKAEASMKNHMQEMMERQIGPLASDKKANQAKAEADRKADQAKIEANMQEIVAEMKADPYAHMQEVVAKTVSAIEGKIVHSIRSEQDGKIQDRSENVTERQEIPKEGAAVASLKCKEQGPRNWNPERNVGRSLRKRPQCNLWE